MKTRLSCFIAVSAALFLGACGSKEDDGVSEKYSGAFRLEGEALEAAINYRSEAAAEFYKSEPDFFKTAKIEDLPANLKWENGGDQPEFASPKAIRGGEERIMVPDFPRTLRVVGDDSSNSFRTFIHDDHNMPLVKKHPATGRHFPAIAKEWAVSDDRKTVFFRIDPKAEFSDGVPVRANHFAFIFYFMRSTWINAPWYNNWHKEKYTHLTQYDDLTISVGLTDGKPDFLRFFEEDLFPLPEHFYDEFGEDFLTRYTWRFPPTTGPYVIFPKDIRKGRSITQTRLDNWWANDKKFWKHRFNPDTRKFSVVRDPDKAVESFVSGDFEMIRIRTPDVWEEKLETDNVKNGYIIRAQFYNQTPRPCYSLRLNTSKPLLDDLNVRLGLQHATDFNLVLEQYFRGQYQRMNTSNDHYGQFSNPNIRAREYSIVKAREYFAKAGFDKSGPDGILMNEKGDRLSFSLLTGYKRLTDVLGIIQQSARKAGVEFEIDIPETTAAWKKVQEKKHEVVLAALNHSVEMYPRYWDFWHGFNAYKEDGSLKSETNNFTVTSYPEWDALIDRYDKSTDLEEIKTIAHELEQKIHDDAAFIPGWIRPFFQCGYWRWVKWPEDFSSRLAREHDELCIHWIDPEVKAETLEAMKSGKTFEEQTLIFDQHKID